MMLWFLTLGIPDFNTPISPYIPRLSGQYQDYLARALAD